MSGIAETAESAAIVHTLVQLGKVLGLETIAEGIENDDQRQRLRTEGVDIGQGFLFARPMGAAEVDRLFDGSPVRRAAAAPADRRPHDAPHAPVAGRPRVGQRR